MSKGMIAWQKVQPGLYVGRSRDRHYTVTERMRGQWILDSRDPIGGPRTTIGEFATLAEAKRGINPRAAKRKRNRDVSREGYKLGLQCREGKDAAARKCRKRQAKFAQDPKLRAEHEEQRRLIPLRNPPAALAELGQVLDVELDTGHKVEFPRRPLLLWNPGRKELVFFTGLDTPRSEKTTLHRNLADAKAGKAFASFHAKNPKGERRLRVPKLAGKAQAVGRVRTISYRSKKWKRNGSADYIHEFNSSVALRRKGKNPAVWTVRGGNLRITARGIEG